MMINIQLTNEALLEQAQQLGGHQTQEETITEALKEYIRWRQQIEAMQHFGTIDFDPAFLAEMERRTQPIEEKDEFIQQVLLATLEKNRQQMALKNALHDLRTQAKQNELTEEKLAEILHD